MKITWTFLLHSHFLLSILVEYVCGGNRRAHECRRNELCTNAMSLPADFSCASKGRQLHPTDCFSYVICHRGQPNCQCLCPLAGMYFDKHSRLCMYARSEFNSPCQIPTVSSIGADPNLIPSYHSSTTPPFYPRENTPSTTHRTMSVGGNDPSVDGYNGVAVGVVTSHPTEVASVIMERAMNSTLAAYRVIHDSSLFPAWAIAFVALIVVILIVLLVLILY